MDAETTILLKNEDHNFEEICNLEHFNNCKLVFSSCSIISSSLLLGASNTYLKELLECVPPYIDQCIILPDFKDFNHFFSFTNQRCEADSVNISGDKEIISAAVNLTCKLEPQVWSDDEDSNDDDTFDQNSRDGIIDEYEASSFKEENTKKTRKRKKGKGSERVGIGLPSKDYIHGCEECGRKFNGILGLELHIRKEHDSKANINPFFEYLENNQFRCKVCGFVNNSRSAMRRHCNVNHVKKKTVTCDVCCKDFHSDADLTKHMICHTKEKSHFCTECGEGFVYPLALKRHHLKDHATEEERTAAKNRYQCDICGFSDMFLNRLKRHMEIHNSSRNYACDICGKTFTSKHYIQQHTRQAHVLPPPPPKKKSAEQKAKEAAKARIRRAIKSGKLPEQYNKLLPEPEQYNKLLPEDNLSEPLL